MGAFDKIGLHIVGNGVKPEALATAPCVCLVDCSVEYIREVRAANPAAWIVVRWVVVDQDSYLADPHAGAFRWFDEHMDAIMATRGPRVVYQGLNEIGDAQAEAYAEFEHTRAGLLWRIGAGLGLGGWSVGCPDWHLWALFRLTLQGMDADDAILLHEYWADPSDLSKRWFTARWMDERVQAHVTGHNIIVTEIGRDVLWENNCRRGEAGWRKTIGADQMLMEVARYNALLMESPDVLGACGFTAGRLGEWYAFDWNQLWPRIAATQGKPEPAPVPQPAPEALPENETATDAPTLAEKNRYWCEEATRQIERGNYARALDILHSMVRLDSGLFYRLERKIKQG